MNVYFTRNQLSHVSLQKLDEMTENQFEQAHVKFRIVMMDKMMKSFYRHDDVIDLIARKRNMLISKLDVMLISEKIDKVSFQIAEESFKNLISKARDELNDQREDARHLFKSMSVKVESLQNSKIDMKKHLSDDFLMKEYNESCENLSKINKHLEMLYHTCVRKCNAFSVIFDEKNHEDFDYHAEMCEESESEILNTVLI